MSLTILAGLADAAQLSQQDLTTLDTVRQYLQTNGPDLEQDPVVSALITRASAAIERWAGRLFAPRPEVESRTFDYGGSGVLIPPVFDLRGLESILDYADRDVSQQVTLASTDYLLTPAYPQDGVYYGLFLPNAGITTRRMTVTGYWGMTAVPPDVEWACIITVREWLRPVSGFNHPFTSDAPPERPVSIPYAAQDLLAPFRVPTIA